MKTEFWTMFWYGGNETICSQHKTEKAAIRAARACERRGGSRHRIVKVQTVKNYGK